MKLEGNEIEIANQIWKMLEGKNIHLVKSIINILEGFCEFKAIAAS